MRSIGARLAALELRAKAAPRQLTPEQERELRDHMLARFSGENPEPLTFALPELPADEREHVQRLRARLLAAIDSESLGTTQVSKDFGN